MRALFYINNVEVHEPDNGQDLTIQLMWDRDNTGLAKEPKKAVSINRWEWGLGDQTNTNDPARLINQWITDGFVTEGIPFRIELEDEGITDVLFDGYLDPQTATYDCDIVLIDAVEKKQIDWLNDTADSATYERMFSEGEFDRTKFISIPYIISTIPNAFEAMLSILSAFSVMFIFTSQLQMLLELLLGSLNPLQFMDIIKLILRGIYVATMFVTLAIIIKQIINLLVQPVKYHDAMFTRDLLEIGAAHFGFTFASDIYSSTSPYYNEVILPKKFKNYINESKDSVLGWLTPNSTDTYGYYNGTFGDLLKKLRVKYNAKVFFIGNQLRLERRDYRIGSPRYILDPVDDKDYRLNANELVSNRVVEFLLDDNDKNTYQRYLGTLTQVITKAISVRNADYKLLKSYEKRTIQFARGNRKEDFTLIEKIIKGFAVVIDPIANAIVNVFNGVMGIFSTIIGVVDTILSALSVVGVNISVQGLIDKFNNLLSSLGVPRTVAAVISGNPVVVFAILNIDTNNLPSLSWDNIGDAIEERLGMLLMEQDFVLVDKMFIINPSSTAISIDVSTTDVEYENSEYIYNNYHAIDSFIPTSTNPNGNQYKIYSSESIPFCFQNYLDVKNNNYMFNYDDKESELISLNWSVLSNSKTASIEYKINEKYTDNLQQEIITLTGE